MRLSSDGTVCGEDDHSSHWVSSNASAASRDNMRGDGRSAGGEGVRLPFDSDRSGVDVDRCSRDGSAVTCCGSDSQLSHHNAILDSDAGDHDSDDHPKQGTKARVEPIFREGEERDSAKPISTLDGGELITRQPQQTESGVQSNETDQEKTLKEHPARENSLPSPTTASGDGCVGHGQRRIDLDNGESSPGWFTQPQSPTRGHETSCTPVIGLEGGIGVETGNTSRIQGK